MEAAIGQPAKSADVDGQQQAVARQAGAASGSQSEQHAHGHERPLSFSTVTPPEPSAASAATSSGFRLDPVHGDHVQTRHQIEHLHQQRDHGQSASSGQRRLAMPALMRDGIVTRTIILAVGLCRGASRSRPRGLDAGRRDDRIVASWQLADEVAGSNVERFGEATHCLQPRSRAVLQALGGVDADAGPLGQRTLGQQAVGAPVA